MTRKGLGPWLRGEMGPYDGIVASTINRVGRNVQDMLNTQEPLTSQDRVVVTADHAHNRLISTTDAIHDTHA